MTFVSQACTKDCHQKQTAFGIGVGFDEACTWVYHVQAFGYWLILESLKELASNGKEVSLFIWLSFLGVASLSIVSKVSI